MGCVVRVLTVSGVHREGTYRHWGASWGYLPSVGCAVGVASVELMMQDMMLGLQRFSTALRCDGVSDAWMKSARHTALHREDVVSPQHRSLTATDRGLKFTSFSLLLRSS